jgi:O-antigen/teichoic acid export membrane protein
MWRQVRLDPPLNTQPFVKGWVFFDAAGQVALPLISAYTTEVMAAEKVTRNTAYLTAAFVGQKLLSFLYFSIIARQVGVEGAGRYFIAVSLTTIWSVFVDLGLANVLVREVAKHQEKAGSLLANVLGLKILFAIGAVIAASLTSWLIGYPPEIRLMIAIASVVMVLDSLHLVFYAVMRGFQNLKYEAIGVVSGQACTIALGSVFIAMRLPLPFLVVALLAGSTWNVIWSSWAMRRYFGVGISFTLEPAIVKFFWSVTIPFALAGIFSRVYSYIDSILLSKIIDVAAVGIYSVAYKICFAFQFLPMAFAAAMYPAMSEYYHADRDKLARLFAATLKYLLVVAAPLALGIAAIARPVVLAVYGEPFLGSVLPLQILMISLIFAYLYWPAGSLLNASDRQAKNTMVMGTTMVVNIILNLLLVPHFEAVGAAMAALAGNATLFFGAFIAARKVTPFDTAAFLSSVLRISASAVAMWAVLWALLPYAHFVLLIPVGVVVYVSMIFVTKGLTLHEMRTFVHILLRKGAVSDIVAQP